MDQPHKAYYMKETVLIGAENKPVKVNKPFELLDKKDMTKWLCLYRESNYDDADYLYKSLNKASRGYGLVISEPEWVEMGDRARAEDWIRKVEDKLGKGGYKFVVFLLDRNDYIYQNLKVHSLCNNGYVSQVIKVYSLKKKCLKCLL